jgi:cytochrome c biogenesis factor
VWAGCLMMALGGLLAAADRRYRVQSRQPASVNRETERLVIRVPG